MTFQTHLLKSLQSQTHVHNACYSIARTAKKPERCSKYLQHLRSKIYSDLLMEDSLQLQQQ